MRLLPTHNSFHLSVFCSLSMLELSGPGAHRSNEDDDDPS